MLDFEFVLLMTDGTLASQDFATTFGAEKAAVLLELKVREITRRGEQITVIFAGKQNVGIDMGATVVLDQRISLKCTQQGDTKHFTAFSGIAVKAPLLPVQMTLVETSQKDADPAGNIPTVVKLKKGFLTVTARLTIDHEGKVRDLKVG